jgi:hypothetical protein
MTNNCNNAIDRIIIWRGGPEVLTAGTEAAKDFNIK